jgi:hypothetical protein
VVAKYIWIYGQLTIGQLALDLSFGYRSKINKYIYIYIYIYIKKKTQTCLIIEAGMKK